MYLAYVTSYWILINMCRCSKTFDFFKELYENNPSANPLLEGDQEVSHVGTKLE
jgi:hypothetical protein